MTETRTATSNPYPLYVTLAGQRAVVVGGGRVAQRKVHTLLEYGADVTLIAPAATDGLRALAQAGRIAWLERPYVTGDLEGAFLTFCATDDRAVNEEVFAEASARNQLVNVVDVPELCNVIVPSVLRRGPLQIAVSTGGASPTTAREIRRALEDQFPSWWAAYIELLGEIRGLIKARVVSGAEARTPLYEAVAADTAIRDALAAGERVDAEDAYDRIVKPLVSAATDERLKEDQA